MDTKVSIQIQFEQAGVWKELTFAERLRAKVSASLVPEDILSILEVGCGDGRVTNLLLDDRRLVVGCDISRTALSHVEAHRVRASVDKLPFRGKSFDGVAAFEVLEHLPDDILKVALDEIKRVTSRYVLLSVPFREHGWAQMVRCAKCGRKYNAYGHLQFFSTARVRRLLLPEFHLVALTLLSVHGCHFGSAPNWLYWFAKQVGGAWFPAGHALCPSCNAKEKVSSQGNIVGTLVTRLIWHLEKRIFNDKPTWIIALYERQEG